LGKKEERKKRREKKRKERSRNKVIFLQNEITQGE
jgi:hypothetical protein